MSRVHVHDLASLCLAALTSELVGAFPVADEEPASTLEVARPCEWLGLPPLQPGAELPQPQAWSGRRVDGRAIAGRLAVAFRFPSFRQGIPAALARHRLRRST